MLWREGKQMKRVWSILSSCNVDAVKKTNKKKTTLLFSQVSAGAQRWRGAGPHSERWISLHLCFRVAPLALFWSRMNYLRWPSGRVFHQCPPPTVKSTVLRDVHWLAPFIVTTQHCTSAFLLLCLAFCLCRTFPRIYVSVCLYTVTRLVLCHRVRLKWGTSFHPSCNSSHT